MTESNTNTPIQGLTTGATSDVTIVDLPTTLVARIADGLWDVCGLDEGPAEDAVMHVAGELLAAGWIDPTGASHQSTGTPHRPAGNDA